MRLCNKLTRRCRR